MKLGSLPIDGAGAFDHDILLGDGEEKSPVSIVQGRVTGEGDCIYGVVVGPRAAAKENRGGCEVESDVTAQFDGADAEESSGHEYGAASVRVTSVNGRLDGGGVQRGAVTLCAKRCDVVDAGAE